MGGIIVDANDIGLWCETFGNKRKSAIILVMGSGGQGILWRDDFCSKLADQGFFVIRYDSRDTGKSTGFDFALHPYNLLDMAEDIVGILNSFGIKKANVVGLSMGGYIAQLLAIHYPERLKSITSMMSTINSSVLRGIGGDSKLSLQVPEAVEKISEIYHRKKNNKADKIDALTDIWEVFNGDKVYFPYEEWHDLAALSYERAAANRAMRNHRLATKAISPNRMQELSTIKTPALFIHGADDPIIQVDHAKYAHKHVPGSKLCIIKDMGHLATSRFDKQIIEALANHCN